MKWSCGEFLHIGVEITPFLWCLWKLHSLTIDDGHGCVVVNGAKFFFFTILIGGYDSKHPRHEVGHVYFISSRVVPRKTNAILLAALNIDGDVDVERHDGPRYGRDESVSIDVPRRNCRGRC